MPVIQQPGIGIAVARTEPASLLHSYLQQPGLNSQSNLTKRKEEPRHQSI